MMEKAEGRRQKAEAAVRRPWFHSAARRQSLQAELARWAGTRWAHAGANPAAMQAGVQADCLWWTHALREIGAIPPAVLVPCYRRREALADGMATLHREILGSGVAELVWSHPWEDGTAPARALPQSPQLLIGDLLLFRQGSSGAHCGMVVRATGHFAHLSPGGFLTEPLTGHWRVALAFVYRLVEDWNLPMGASAPEVR